MKGVGASGWPDKVYTHYFIRTKSAYYKHETGSTTLCQQQNGKEANG